MAHSLTETLINAEVLLPREDSQAIAKVIRRMVDSEGKLIGEHNDNPLLNTLVYECYLMMGQQESTLRTQLHQTSLWSLTRMVSRGPFCTT